MFVEGLEKSYHVPLGDRPAQALVGGSMVRFAVNGTVEISVEIRSDASIGETKVTKSLAPDVDRNCIETFRQTIFLPAVKDRTFVTSWQTPKCGFFYNPRHRT